MPEAGLDRVKQGLTDRNLFRSASAFKGFERLTLFVGYLKYSPCQLVLRLPEWRNWQTQ